MIKSTAIIPARSGSKGVVHKNIRILGGRPLIHWSIQACLKSRNISRIIVSTDSNEYADIATRLGAEVPFLRPTEISGDLSSDYECILHAMDWLRDDDDEPELLVHVRPTTPYRIPTLIDQAISSFYNDSVATSLRSVHEMPESAYKSFELAPSGQLKLLGCDSSALDVANMPRQEFPITYQANGYVDVLSTKFIRSNGMLHGSWVKPFITPFAVEVDTEDDFARLEFMSDHNSEISHSLFG